MAGDTYPSDRPNYFAHKFVRILTRTCAAMEIGTDGFCLLSIIVHTEDAAHYRSPVAYWNDQLLSITGLGTWGRLDRARKKAVRAGWLHYEPGGKGKVGKYWVTIPSQYEGLPDGSVAEDDPVILATSEEENREDNQPSSPPVEKEPWDNRGTTEGQPRDNRGTSADHSKPVPVPVPDPKKRARSIDADVDAAVDAHPFDAFWAVAHRKVGRKAAMAKFQVAVREIGADKRRDLDGQTPEEFLIERMRTFAASPNAHPTDRTPIHPATWLHQGRYDDDPATWQEDGSNQSVAQAPMIDPKEFR